MTKFTAPIAEQIWGMKYQMKHSDGTPIDTDVQDTWDRISTALAAKEGDNIRYEVEEQFYQALNDFKFLPAGRITAGAGTDRDVTLFNCFVMGTVPDSMGGIFSMLREAALTMQQGGGIGYDFSTIRPKGTLVEGVASDASGPLSFMDCWNSMCQTIMSAGTRRGAMMATMRCDHPDVMDFITAKNDPLRLRMFNMSVLVTDPFMAAVKSDTDWDLVFTNKHGETKVYETVRALDLWDAIMQNTYDMAEPGVIFIDRINQMNNLNYCETIAATNPCGEQPLPPYGACLLGSINMAKMVLYPFTVHARFNMDMLESTVRTAVRMMDNVVDVSNFPLDAQRAEAEAKRRLGLGVTGLADMLIMMRVKYGSEEGVYLTDDVMHAVARFAYLESVELAKEKGSFPLFDADKFLESGHMLGMDEDIRIVIREHGIRNALLTSIAPTGTISLYAGNVSSGIEPVFANSYTRKVLQKDGTRTEELVEDYAVYMYRQYCLDNDIDNSVLPDYFVTAQTLTPSDHIRMQSAAQRWVDSSISKTVNVPEDISFEDFKAVYMLAWDTGCKGCTTYRPNDVTGSVLSIEPESKPVETKESLSLVPVATERPAKLDGSTYKIRWPDSDHAMYINLTYTTDVDGVCKPAEIFINSKNMDSFVWTVGLTRMISAVFKVSDSSHFVVEELKAVFDPKGGAWQGGKYVPSILAAIGNVIEQFMLEIGYMQGKTTPISKDSPVEITQTSRAPDACPKCSSTEFKNESGCETCMGCGHSKCG